jgi:FkbM family methyltransferase
VISLLGDVYVFFFGRPFFEKFNKGLFYISSRGLGIRNYTSSKASGEQYVCNNYIANIAAPLVFDIGANKGDWSKCVIKNNPNSIIHLFEPSTANSKYLNNLQGNVTINYVALGSNSGTMLLHDYEDNIGSEHASLLDGVINGLHKKSSIGQKIDVITLDEYCLKNKISFIDFIKIDTEGYEYQVLLGATETLKKVKFLQFEFNEMNTIGRVFFRDFFEMLSSEFDIYRMLPAGLIHIENYSPLYCEQFSFQNILAVNKNA